MEDPRTLHAKTLAAQLPTHGGLFLFAGKQFAGELSVVDANGMRWDEALAEGDETEAALVVARASLPSPMPIRGSTITNVATGERHTVYGVENLSSLPDVTFFLGKGVPA